MPAVPSASDELESLLAHLVAGVVVHALDGEVVRVNPKACELMGLTAAEMLGRGLHDPSWRLLAEDGTEMAVPDYPASRVLTGKLPVVNQTVGVVHPLTGPGAWLLCNAYLEFHADGTLRRAIVMFIDITPRVLAERALFESEMRFRRLFESSLDGVLLMRPDGEVVCANPAACGMFGLTEPEIRARGQTGLADPSDPRLAPMLATRLEKSQTLGRVRMLRGDGSAFEAELSSAVYPGADGSCFIGVIVRDATLRQQAEAATAARVAAESASRNKSALLAKVSHELRTPLNAILGLTASVLGNPVNALAGPDRERLGLVYDAGNHLLRLIEDLLDVSAIEAGRLGLNGGSCDAVAMIREVAAQIAGLAERRAVVIEIPPPDQTLRVRCDGGRTKQVLWNLLSNAIKYNRPGGRVQVRVADAGGNGTIAVVDDGIGMTLAQQQALFQPFNRLGRERSEIAGLGLGMVLAQHLVTQMGGSIRVASEVDRGSEFVVTLPLAPAAAAADADAAAAGPAAAPAVRAGDAAGSAADADADADAPAASPQQPTLQAETPSGAPLRVLYIDDDDVNRLVMQSMVAMLPGWVYAEAADGATGLALALANPPDVLLVDLLMPGMDGWAVLAAAQQSPQLAGTPCVAVSAYAASEDVALARERGFDGYVVKPVLLSNLRHEVDRVLALRQRPLPAAATPPPDGTRGVA